MSKDLLNTRTSMDLEFLRALKCGNAVRIMELAKEKPHLFLGRSPQAATGHLNVVKLFCEKTKSTDDETGRKNSLMSMQDNEGNTALHIAVKYGHSQVVEELTSVDPEPILYINRAGQSLLSIAIDEKWTDIARWIIRKNPNSLNYEGSNQLTLLHSAVIRHNFGEQVHPGETLLTCSSSSARLGGSTRPEVLGQEGVLGQKCLAKKKGSAISARLEVLDQEGVLGQKCSTKKECSARSAWPVVFSHERVLG
ncbi:hypothetical protein ACOSQ2_030838 [Xanthoceras sorbifolium]